MQESNRFWLENNLHPGKKGHCFRQKFRPQRTWVWGLFGGFPLAVSNIYPGEKIYIRANQCTCFGVGLWTWICWSGLWRSVWCRRAFCLHPDPWLSLWPRPCPVLVFSAMDTWYLDWLNWGRLSLISNTVTSIYSDKCFCILYQSFSQRSLLRIWMSNGKCATFNLSPLNLYITEFNVAEAWSKCESSFCVDPRWTTLCSVKWGKGDQQWTWRGSTVSI